MNVEDGVLDKIRPTEEERRHNQQVADGLRAHVRKYLDDNGIDAELRFVGSFSKDTFLSNPDIDLFILFPPEAPREYIEREGLKIGQDLLHGKQMYSEHPYTRGRWQGVDVDLVPSYNLKDVSKLQTAVDRTPFHTQYVLSHMRPSQHDQVRLLKKFMKGIGIYGAEPNIRGFSGYMCELLIMKYGSFLGVLKAVSTDWREGTTVEIEGLGPPMIGPLVVYDPVDRRRNAASAIHLDTLALFIVATQEYLANPDERFFFPHERTPMTAEELDSAASIHGSRILTVMFERPDVIEGNLYSQLWKTQDALAKKLGDFNFNVLRTSHSMDGDWLEIAFELDRDVLSKTVKRSGPPVWVRNAEDFILKWKDGECGEPFIENGAWAVITKRAYSTAREMLEAEVAMAGIGKEIDPGSMKILEHKDSIEHGNRLLLTDLMAPRHSWKID